MHKYSNSYSLSINNAKRWCFVLKLNYVLLYECDACQLTERRDSVACNRGDPVSFLRAAAHAALGRSSSSRKFVHQDWAGSDPEALPQSGPEFAVKVIKYINYY